MNTPFPEPAAAAGPVSAAVNSGSAVRVYRRVFNVVEGVVFWGILAFGILFPAGGVLYAWMR